MLQTLGVDFVVLGQAIETTAAGQLLFHVRDLIRGRVLACES